MLLFIASEIMVFGSFFTAYFFVRVVNNYPWPPEGSELPKYVAGVNTWSNSSTESVTSAAMTASSVTPYKR